MSRVIVTSHFKEDLTWLKKATWPVVLIDHYGSVPPAIQPARIIPNLGLEASSYLRYIIDWYDDLPEHIAFIHGHEESYHQKPNILKLIEDTELTSDMYVSLNNGDRCFEKNVPSGYRGWPGIIDRHWHVLERWGFGPKPTVCPCTELAAQFIISRNRIYRWPKQFYEDMFAYSLTPYDNYYIVCFFEWTWHYIFGEPWKRCVIHKE